MKLLSPQQVKSNSNLEQADKIRKITEIDQEIANKINELNSTRNRCDRDRAKLEADFGEFFKEIFTNRRNLTQEVEDLEARKKKAEEPLDAREYEITAKERVLDNRERNCETREQNASKYELSLKTRELDVLTLKKDLEKRETKLSDELKHSDERKRHFDGYMAQKEARLNDERNRIRQLMEDYKKLIK